MSRKSIVLRLPTNITSDIKDFSEETQLLILSKAIEIVKAPAPTEVAEDEDLDLRSIISKEVDDMLVTIEEVFDNDSDDEDSEDEESSEGEVDEQRTVAHQQIADILEELVNELSAKEDNPNIEVIESIVIEELSTPINWALDERNGLATIVYG